MARTDATQIKAIIELDDDSTDLSPFINAANELVTECCASAGYSNTRLAMIETWLAAHFYCILAPRMGSVGAGVGVSYQNRVDLGLKLSGYGQHAMRLDTKGGLASLDKKIEKGGGKVGAFWLGTDLDLLQVRSEFNE